MAEYRNQERYKAKDYLGEAWRGSNWRQADVKDFTEEVAIGLNNLD